MQQQPKRVAVLGGGVGALTTAAALTDPDLKGAYEVTVYQLGWRLGGKGASGRNAEVYDRIEEHGLHVWSGFYDNAFRVMRQAYQEAGRAPDAPMATCFEAFRPADFMVLEERYKDTWNHWFFEPPTNDQLPGAPDAHVFLPFWSYVGEGMQLLRQWFRTAHHAHHQVRGSESLLARAAGNAAVLAVDAVGLVLKAGLGVGRALHRVLRRPGSVHAQPMGGAVMRGLLRALLAVMTPLVHRHWRKVQGHLDDLHVRRSWIFLNFAYANLRGIVKDGVLTGGLDVIDDVDYRDWVARHAVDDQHAGRALTADSPLAFFMYDAIFSYEAGDMERPRLSATVALYTLMRLALTWKGAVIWEMQAGMGDTVFAPLYEMLKRRGVRFEFFRRVHDLQLSEDGASMASIRIGRQALLKDPEAGYQPLVDVKGLPSWPSAPLYDQLQDGDRYRDVNFEYWDAPDVDEMTLTAGDDFDLVVLGIPIGSLPYLCGELIEADPAWKRAVDHVGTVRTQALQLWLQPTATELGWAPGKQPMLTTYDVGPIDTWADMTHLLEREGWPSKQGQWPQTIAYFCGPMADGDEPLAPSPRGPVQPPSAFAQPPAERHTRGIVLDLLKRHMHYLWPKAASETDFDWDLLVDDRPAPGMGEARLDAQYVRANVQPTERYVQSLPGTARHRLGPGPWFGTLYVAGDWTQNTFNAGCVEAATMSGLLAANAISGHPKKTEIVGLAFGHTPDHIP